MEFKNQHFVPESYIRAWRDPKSLQGAYVWVSPKGGGPLSLASPRRLFAREDFYTVIDSKGERILELEERLHQAEDPFIKLRDRRLGTKTRLRPKDRLTIAEFAATLYARIEFQKREQTELWEDALRDFDQYPLEYQRC